MSAQNRKGPTPRKTARPRPAAKPTTVGINFDTWARDEELAPFPITIGGKEYVSLDPFDLDFRELAAAIDAPPEDLFRLLFPDDAEEILSHDIKLGAMVAFNQAVVVHFGLEDFIAAQS